MHNHRLIKTFTTYNSGRRYYRERNPISEFGI